MGKFVKTVDMTKKIKGFKDTIAWYEANAKQYALTISNLSNRELQEKFSLAVGQGKKVLDAGCAAGRDTQILSELGLEVTGLDLSNSLIGLARESYPDLTFIQGNFLDLPFANESFAGVWAQASLLHLETIEEVTKALEEFNRVLEKGGILHVYVKQQLGQAKTAVVADNVSLHERFFRWFTKTEVEFLVAKTGFEILQIQDNLPDIGGRLEVKWIYCLARKK